MKMKRAISPIAATVMIVAATIIPAAALSGFIYGVFGSTSTTPNITVLAVSFTHLGTSNVGTIVLTNSGTGSAYVLSVTLNYQGASCTLSSVSGGGPASPILGGARQTLTISVVTAGQYCSGVTAATGNAFNGAVYLTNQAETFFTGKFA
jgi:FlaG/FlaF family flagellin (archaellin)